MARKTTKVYNPETRKWETKVVNTSSKSTGTKKSTTSKTSVRSGNSKSGSKTTTNPKTAKGKAEKKKKKIEYYTLSGNLNIKPSQQTMTLRSAQTVNLQKLGKYLSGKYYIASMEYKIDASNGFSMTAEVYRPKFRQNIKTKKKNKTKAKSSKITKASYSSSLKDEVDDNARVLGVSENDIDTTGLRTYTINGPSDSLWALAVRYYGDCSKWKQIYLKNTGETPDPRNLVKGMVVVIP